MEEPGVLGQPRCSRGDPGTHGDPGFQVVAPLDAPMETQVLRNLLLIPPWSHISRAWWWCGGTWWPWRNLVSREHPGAQGGPRHPVNDTLGCPNGDPSVEEPPVDPTLEPHLKSLTVGRRNLVSLENLDVQGETQAPMGTQVSGWWHPWTSPWRLKC